MPVYNSERYLKIAIDSVLKQTYRNFELLIFDDGSTDNSLAIIKSYKDERIKTYHSKTKKGYVVHLNEGLRRAKGDYIARMDADDICLPQRFEKQINYLKKNKLIVLVGCFGFIINEEGKVVDKLPKPIGPDKIKKSCLYYGPHIHPTIMFRKNVINKVGRYREKYLYVEDIDLYYRLIFSGYKTDNIPEYLFKYRVHPNSTNRYFKEKNTKSFRLKWETQKQFKLTYTVKELISIYVHYILGVLFTFEQKSKIEKLIKNLMHK